MKKKKEEGKRAEKEVTNCQYRRHPVVCKRSIQTLIFELGKEENKNSGSYCLGAIKLRVIFW